MSKRVLITGCSSGIGRALAEELTRRGYEVIATARNVDSLHGLNVSQKLSLDVTSALSVETAVSAAGRIDVLVNNAGVGLWGAVEAASIEQTQRLFDTNVYGVLRVQNAVLPQMRARRSGSIIQISSAAGRFSGPLVGLYAASKHALEAFSAALRVEVAPFNIKVAIIEIGAVASDFGNNRMTANHADYDAVVEHFRAKLMAARQAATSAEDVALAVATVVDSGAPDLMVEATADARAMAAKRGNQTYAQWEAELLDGVKPL
jgi:NADP-dependent 3-hydroxy acid dehydrogenase YdfG